MWDIITTVVWLIICAGWYYNGRLNKHLQIGRAIGYWLYKLNNDLDSGRLQDLEALSDAEHETLVGISKMVWDNKQLKQYAKLWQQYKKEVANGPGTRTDFNQT